MLRNIFIFFRKNTYSLSLFLLIVLGLSLRLNHIDKWTWAQNGFDESRDMLVVRHIVEYGEKISKGPLAAGGFNWLQNSPIYYYFLASIWFFTGNPLSFIIIWAFLLSSMIPISYLLGKNIWDKKLGLIIAALLALNPTLIDHSKELLQPFLLPFFSLFFLFFLTEFYKRKTLRTFCLSIFFLLIGLHFHYGVLLILPIGISWIIYFWFLLINKEEESKNIYIPAIIFFLTIGSWVLLTYRDFPLDQIYFFTFNFSEEPKSLLDLLKKILIVSNENLWYRNTHFIQLIVLKAFLIIVVIYWLIVNKQNKKNLVLVGLPISMLFSSFFMIVSRGYIANTYMIAVLPFFIVSIAISLRILIKLNKFAGTFITTIICLVFYSTSVFYKVNNTPKISYHDQKYLMAQTIANDLKTNHQNNNYEFAIALLTTTKIMPYDLWGTGGLWFYLEILLNEKLVSLIDLGVNFYPNFDTNTHDTFLFYFVCDHRTSQELIDTECLERFKSVRPYLKEAPNVIYHSNEFTLWKFRVNTKEKIFGFNKVYKDLIK